MLPAHPSFLEVYTVKGAMYPQWRNLDGSITIQPIDIETAFSLGQSRTSAAQDVFFTKYPHLSYNNPRFTQLAEKGTLKIKMSVEARQREKVFQEARARTHGLPYPTVPLFHAIRLDNVVTKDMQRRLEVAYAEIRRLDCLTYTHEEDHRHVDFWNPIYHFGRWERQGNIAAITRDTWQPCNNPATCLARQKAILYYCALWTKVMLLVRERISEYDPETILRQRAGVGVSHSLTDDSNLYQEAIDHAKILSGCPSPLSFASLGTAIASTYGQAEAFHLDMLDMGYSFTIPISSMGWGDDHLPTHEKTAQILLPQLGYRIPLRAGQVLAFRAGTLLHSATPIPANVAKQRLMNSIFTCNNLAARALRGVPQLGMGLGPVYL